MDSWVQLIIALVGGGGIVGIITAVAEARKNKRNLVKENVDERISFWEKAAHDYEDRIRSMESKHTIYDDAIRALEAHISVLEHLIIRNDPDIELPPRPPINLSPPKVSPTEH